MPFCNTGEPESGSAQLEYKMLVPATGGSLRGSREDSKPSIRKTGGDRCPALEQETTSAQLARRSAQRACLPLGQSTKVLTFLECIHWQ